MYRSEKNYASVKGGKTELMDRLELDDKSITPQHTPSPEPSMILPSSDMYHDLNRDSKLPPFEIRNLKHYFERFNKTLDTFKKLYEVGHLFLIRSTFVHNYYYIRGFVKENMEILQCQVDIKMDEHGVIEECHCECSVGAGIAAHCKHVGVVLFGILHMVKYRRIITAETKGNNSSSRSRRFFSGTPVKAEDLSDRKHSRSVIFEPYPMSKIDKKSYNDRFRNLVLNFKSNMPIKQLYGPADSIAMSQDHSYLEHCPKE